MQLRLGGLCALAASVMVVTACGGGTPPAPTAAPQSTAKPATGGDKPASGSAAAPTSKPASSSSSSSSSSTELQVVPIPANAAAYDPAKRAKAGEAVKLPSGMVFQLHGARTQDKDATTEWVMADITVGNGTQEDQPVSSVLSFDVLTTDCKRYGLTLGDIMTLATAAASGAIPTTFDETLEPGQARRGNAMVLVPKDARGLALGYTSQGAMMGSLATMAGQIEDPVLYAPLGIRGDWAPTGGTGTEPCPRSDRVPASGGGTPGTAKTK